MTPFSSFRSCFSSRPPRNIFRGPPTADDPSPREAVASHVASSVPLPKPSRLSDAAQHEDHICPKHQSSTPAGNRAGSGGLQITPRSRIESLDGEVDSPTSPGCCTGSCAGPSKRGSEATIGSRTFVNGEEGTYEHPSVQWSQSCKHSEPSQNKAGRAALHGRKKSGMPGIRTDSGCVRDYGPLEPDLYESDVSCSDVTKSTRKHSDTDTTTGTKAEEGQESSDSKDRRRSDGMWQLEWFTNEKDAKRRAEELQRRGHRNSFHHLHSSNPDNPHGKRGREGSAKSSTLEELVPKKQSLGFLDRLSSIAIGPNQLMKRHSDGSNEPLKSPSSWAPNQKRGHSVQSSGIKDTDESQDTATSRRSVHRLSSALANIHRRGQRRTTSSTPSSISSSVPLPLPMPETESRAEDGIFWN
jgi:hypothetical protein